MKRERLQRKINAEKGNYMNGEKLLSTTDISKIFGMNLSSAFIKDELEIEPDLETKVGIFWKERKIRHISYELSQYAYGIGQEYLINLHEQEEA